MKSATNRGKHDPIDEFEHEGVFRRREAPYALGLTHTQDNSREETSSPKFVTLRKGRCALGRVHTSGRKISSTPTHWPFVAPNIQALLQYIKCDALLIQLAARCLLSRAGYSTVLPERSCLPYRFSSTWVGPLQKGFQDHLMYTHQSAVATWEPQPSQSRTLTLDCQHMNQSLSRFA